MNVIATRAAEGFPRRAFTVAEIRQMVEAGIIAEDENFELIEGELVPKFPKGNQHEIIKAAISHAFVRQAPSDYRLAIVTSLYLDERTFVCPDCGLKIDRDLNAAVNLARYRVPSTGSGPEEVKPGRGAERETDPAQAGDAAGCEASTPHRAPPRTRRGPSPGNRRIIDSH
jgi:predicted RNA-binding Zn-ribbon protein involved in translation (DUF1610 family)